MSRPLPSTWWRRAALVFVALTSGAVATVARSGDGQLAGAVWPALMAAAVLWTGWRDRRVDGGGAAAQAVLGTAWLFASLLALLAQLGVLDEASGASPIGLVAVATVAALVRTLRLLALDRRNLLMDGGALAGAAIAAVGLWQGDAVFDGGTLPIVVAGAAIALLAVAFAGGVPASTARVLDLVGAVFLAAAALSVATDATGAATGRPGTVLATGLAAVMLSSAWPRPARDRSLASGVVVASGSAVVAGLAVLQGADDRLVLGGVAATAIALALRRATRASEATDGRIAVLEARMRTSEERFRVGFGQAPVGMLVARPDGTLIEANAALERMLGSPEGTLTGRSLLDMIDPEERSAAAQLLVWARRDELEPGHLEVTLRPGAGAGRRVSMTVGLVHDSGNSFVLALLEDRTEQRELSERLRFAEHFDEVTGLLRRAGFVERFGAVLTRRGPGAPALWVLALDLDGFTELNEGLGHDTGDLVLRSVAARLRDMLRGNDLLARFGADEFVAVVAGASDDDLRALAHRLAQQVAQPLAVPGGEVFCSATIGAASVVPGRSTEAILRSVDAVLHRAKHRGRGQIEIAVPDGDGEGHADASKRVRVGGELHRAIERGEFRAYFQPIVDLRTGRLKGFEALARWLHPERGLVPPGDFIELAEETGLIVPIGRAVLHDALGRLAAWRAAGPHDERGRLTMAVNLSARQLTAPALVATVVDEMDRSGVDPTAVILELTESAIMADPAAAKATMVALRERGPRLAVDDFGTGYSSLSYLQQFPVNILKIDRAFVRGLGVVDGDTAIVEAVLRLGHSLGMEVVAEGVETDLQHASLHALGCEFGQGYLFGRPLAAAQVEAAFAQGTVFGPIWARPSV
ncbi:MAG: putative bifunctional diguanylate cyclase/phosphodiesterase [Acidimicrobiales bacterium]